MVIAIWHVENGVKIMVTRLTDSLMSVDPEQAILLRHRGEQTICSIERQLWLSQEGLADDIVLSPGECVTLRGRGRVAAQALCGRAAFVVKRQVSFVSALLGQLIAFFSRINRAVRKGDGFPGTIHF